MVAGGKQIDAQAYFADQTAEGLALDPVYLRLAIEGAEEHKLSGAYVGQLRAMMPQVVSAIS